MIIFIIICYSIIFKTFIFKCRISFCREYPLPKLYHTAQAAKSKRAINFLKLFSGLYMIDFHNGSCQADNYSLQYMLANKAVSQL